jgi:TolA-binding protein
MLKALPLLLLILFAPAVLAQRASYPAALASYRAGEFAKAEGMFRSIVEAAAPEPATMKARYFLARSLMKQRKFEEASSLLIGIHRISPMFYREWGCDFLLGVCREGLGRS